ncbi:MAG: Uma2 family endonuclease [Chloroflexota bacterium]|nr:Uma2 family endonuclease [Chloroflexota bacterium]MDE2961018.1 Uma2 family endonuclease [Chloroflexota bacterium]
MTTTQHGAKLTLAEYLALEIDGLWELVDGELCEMPPPNLDHQRLVGFLYRMLCTYLDGTTPSLGEALWGVGVALSESRMLIPDLVFVRAGREDIQQANYLDGVPDLVVEALSTDRQRDLALKRAWYAEAGVPEYWILDPVNDTLTVLELSGGEYTERAVLGHGDTLTTLTIPGFELPLEHLFGHPMRTRSLSR